MNPRNTHTALYARGLDTVAADFIMHTAYSRGSAQGPGFVVRYTPGAPLPLGSMPGMYAIEDLT